MSRIGIRTLIFHVCLLQADVSQQESERIRLRRELEDARNMSSSTLTTQQGKLSEIMSGKLCEDAMLSTLLFHLV